MGNLRFEFTVTSPIVKVGFIVEKSEKEES